MHRNAHLYHHSLSFSCLFAIRVDEWMKSHIVVLTFVLQVYSRLGLDLHFRTFFYFICIYQESLVINIINSFYFPSLLLLCVNAHISTVITETRVLRQPHIEYCIMRNSQKVDAISRTRNLCWGQNSLSDPIPSLYLFLVF